MKKVVLLGGGGHLGRSFQQILCQKGYEVTVSCRQKPATIHQSCKWLFCDKTNEQSLRQILCGEDWNCVVDLWCMERSHAQNVVRVLNAVPIHYVMVSTTAVYNSRAGIISEIGECWKVDPSIFYSGTGICIYGMNKRVAEEILQQNLRAPLTIIRFPYILSESDPGQRLQADISEIKMGSSIGVYHPDAKLSLTYPQECARFCYWLIERNLTGVFNCCSQPIATTKDYFEFLGRSLGMKVKLVPAETARYCSTVASGNLGIDCGKAMTAGYQFDSLWRWLGDLVAHK